MLAANVSAAARAPSNEARRTNADRRASTASTRSPSSDGHDPVADGDVGADVADAADVRRDGRHRDRAGPCSSPRSSRDTRPGEPGAPRSSHASSNHASQPELGAARPSGSATRHVISSTRPHASAVVASMRAPLERQCGGALAADAAGDARRAAGAGDQPEAELGQRDHRVGRGDDVVGQRRDLDAGAHARPVQVHVQLVGDEVGEPGRAAREPGDVGDRRVRERPELAEVATAAERRPVAGQVHGGDRVVGGGERQRLRQRVAQRHRHCVVAARAG